jgi:hypothetical protein
MWNRKNFLIFALFLNCIFFLGTAVLMSRSLSNNDRVPMLAMMDEGVQRIVQALTMDPQTKIALTKELSDLDLPKGLEDWAKAKNIINLIEINNAKPTEWIGSRKRIPFLVEQLELDGAIGFYRSLDQLNFNYFLQTENKTFLATQQVPADSVKALLEAYVVDLSIVESEGENSPLLLYSTLSPAGVETRKSIADELLFNIPFEEQEFDFREFTLSQEKHLIKMVNLVHSSKLKQKLLFTKKVANYAALSIKDIHIFIWTFFIISIVMNIVLFKFSSRLDA